MPMEMRTRLSVIPSACRNVEGGNRISDLTHDLARNFRFAVEGNAGNIYGGGTLEWLPTGLYSARSIPVVRSRDPLWEDPGLSRDVEEGRYLLPFSATGRRETIVTSPLRAEPQYLQIMPGPSAWPLLGALFTAGFFLLMTIQAYTPAIISGLLAIPSIMRWLWETDRPVAERFADIGGGIRLPTYVTGASTHGWWAMVILLMVILMMFVMTIFSFGFLYGIHPAYWQVVGDKVTLLPILTGYAAAAGLSLFGRRLLARERSTHWSPTSQVAFGGLAAALAFGVDVWSLSDLEPQLSAQAALIAAFLAQQGMLIAITLLMVVHLALRTSRAIVTRPRNTTFDVIVMFLVYTAAQGVVTACLIRLFPGGF